MSDYSTLTATLVQAVAAAEDDLYLMNANCRSRFLLHPHPTPKVFLFFHGFTAAPAQFVPIGKTFFEAGHNVLIPLLPGHGLAGDWNSGAPPPLPEDRQIYQQFGQDWLSWVQDLGEEVVLGGLSGGATLAIWLALEHPERVDQTLLFAPYLRNSNVVLDWVIRILNIYFEWKSEPGTTHFGYDGFRMPALRLFLEMGQEVLDRTEKQPSARSLIVSSGSDAAVNNKDLRSLFESIRKHHPKSWYHCFDKELDIPHTMMTEAEGNECIDLLIAVAKAYVESDLTWTEVKEISDRIAQGRSFDAAVAELHLSQKVSPDLITLVTLKAD
ncbi:MAG: lysophospholipase [Leptolyngbyaceae cyanobacterium SM1_4_3]|nr:lysophospholipase [Leptolyngbyaceae cyanobacterium SM1_4_3]NJN89013.1 lysophospholipase [Leptolyngbyaceae cyanobacterium SL_5_14]